jgi:16S rRNA (cytosine1402-N4)-methyltransferase
MEESMSGDKPVHKRRVRYKGKNPRRFEDRYKELNPEKYPEHAKHIVAKGSTPAGSHRPICVDEILAVLKPQAGDMGLDATLGYGGHSQLILPRLLPGGKLFAVDADPIELHRTEERMRALGFDEGVFVPRQMNFSAVRSLIYEAGGGFDCILADLGVSSMQLDNPERGFSHKSDGPLDLRLNPRRGTSAAEVLKARSAEELERIFSDHADEPHAKIIAQAIKSSRAPLDTTTQLVGVIKARLQKIRPDLPEKSIKKSLQRTFMALRIEVNDEFGALERFLRVLPKCLKSGGRVAVLSFHSGEDRRVKRAFAAGMQTGIYSSVASKPARPSPEERRSNPRSTCAKLRWAVRSDLDCGPG